MPAPHLFFILDLVHRLTTEFGYSPQIAEKVASQLVAMSPDIKGQFWQWWNTGQDATDLVVNGYTVAKLKDEFGLNPIAAFSTLDWMMREPDVALQTLRRNDFI